MKLQGHTAKEIVHFYPNWLFPDCNSSLNSLMVIGIDHLYSLRCRGWYCNPEQHELCRPSRGRRPYKWSISILPRSQFTKSKGNLRFRRLVPLFVPIGVCMTTGLLVTSQLVCDVIINRPRTTSAMANLGFRSQSSLAM